MNIKLKSNTTWKTWLPLATFFLLVVYAGFAISGKQVKSIDTKSLSFQTVQQGDLDIYITSYGELIPAQEKLLTAPALGTVSEILIRPGSKVTPNTAILKLTNPRLEQEVKQAHGALAQQQANLEAFKFEQKSARLNYQGKIADIKANIEQATLELEVNENLQSLGVASKIDLQRARLNLKQQNKRLEFEFKKYQQFVEMQSYQLKQQQISVNQQQLKLNVLKQQSENMLVTADIDGTLQTLDVELGQSVQLGQALAKVGSNKQLMAKIRLPQHKADKILLNAPVLIRTNHGEMDAKISRIESVVTGGSVLAEAVITSPLTDDARPSLNVVTEVFIQHKKQALYVKQTPGLHPNSKQSVFLKQQQALLKQEVIFAGISKSNLIIESGLSENDQLVVSDMSKYNNFLELQLQP